PQQRMIASMRMIAKIPTLAAMAYKYTIGQPFVYPKNSLSFAENFLHMGFGHRVYKNYDPRAKIMQKMCHAVLAETGHGDDQMLKVAMELEKIALNDAYFIDRKLYPNVDFYSGITLKAM